MPELSSGEGKQSENWVLRYTILLLGFWIVGVLLIDRYEAVPTAWERCVDRMSAVRLEGQDEPELSRASRATIMRLCAGTG